MAMLHDLDAVISGLSVSTTHLDVHALQHAWASVSVLVLNKLIKFQSQLSAVANTEAEEDILTHCVATDLFLNYRRVTLRAHDLMD